MTSSQSVSQAAAYHRPKKLYRYSQRQYLERSLQLGEFRLRPPLDVQSMMVADRLVPPADRSAKAGALSNFLTLSFSSAWDAPLFDAFGGADCCLVIHEPEQLGERIHRAAQRLLPSWAGIDAAVSYGAPSPLGAAFSKSREHASEKEWLFAWRPTQPSLGCMPVIIRLGSIESIAELRIREAVN